MIWIILIFSCNLAFAQFNTYDLIIEYEQECFADSSQVSHHVGNGMPCIGTSQGMYYEDWKCESSYHYNELVWVHKEPTWDGFREFVKRKYQKLVQPK
jgi:hypothetical protein